MSIRLTRNGYDVKFFETVDEAQEHINSVLESNKDLYPKLIYRHYNDSEVQPGEVAKKTICSVLIYRYYTEYSEMFLVEQV